MPFPALAALLLLPLTALAADQPLLAKSLVVKSPAAGQPGFRKLVAKAYEPVFVRDGGVPLSDHEALAVRFGWTLAGS